MTGVLADDPADPEAGNAIIEFLFVAVLVLVPLVYLVVGVASVQRARLATTSAARDVGRSIATTRPGEDADQRAAAALRISLASHGYQPGDVELRYVSPSTDCRGPAIIPSLAPGSEFAVCVIRHQQLPAVPSIVGGRGITSIGRFVVHLDEFRRIS